MLQFDGDKTSLNFLWTQGAIDEIGNAFKSKSFFIGNDGKLVFSVATYTNDIVMKLFTGGDTVEPHTAKIIKT